MGSYVPRITSPVTGEPEAAPSTGYVFEPTAENMARWDRVVALRQPSSNSRPSCSSPS